MDTCDNDVKTTLRQLSEPICLFGEGPAERRLRLREHLAILGEESIFAKRRDETAPKTNADTEETWYHEGPASLQVAREFISYYSLSRAADRLEEGANFLKLPLTTRNAKIQDIQKRLHTLTIYCSQIGDRRPISFCRFSPNSQMLATASWSGLLKLWNIPDCSLIRVLKKYDVNASSIVFHPKATLVPDNELLCSMASSAFDGSVKFWNLANDEPVANIDGHMPYRVSRLEFHPSGRFIGTCCFDNSWRLWDLEQFTEVLHQEGHCKPVFCISFQIDGSICATGGLDSFMRVWDLRTGRCIMLMEGHLKSIYGIDFNCNGYQIATASDDDTCKIWDLRKNSILYTIPAHTNLVSDVRFQKDGGNFLVTSSFDNTAKVWSNKTWQPLKTLSGHDNKIMSVDISTDNKFICTASYDRTFKIWSSENSICI